jgi:ribosomal protein L17
MDSRISFSGHIDVTVGKLLAMLGLTLAKRRSDTFEMFVFDVLFGRIGSPKLLSLVNVIAPRYRTRSGDYLRIDFQRTNCSVHEP